MSLIKKIDVDKHFAARRAARLGRTGPLSQSSARIERTVTTPGTAAFIEDVTPVQVAGESDGTSVSSVSRSRQA
jgi:hypothetical protein